MPHGNEFDLQLLPQNDFCVELIKKAGIAYRIWNTKQTADAMYYSEDNHLTFKQVNGFNKEYKLRFTAYVKAYSDLFSLYINTPITLQQAKFQAKYYFKTYAGQAGNQKQFECYFEACVQHLIAREDEPCEEVDNASDSSDERVFEREKKGHVRHATVLASADDLPTYASIDWQGSAADYIFVDDIEPGAFVHPAAQEPMLIEKKSKDTHLSVKLGYDIPRDTQADIFNDVPLAHESSLAADYVHFSYRQALGKRVRFFDQGPSEVIQVDHKRAITPEMLRCAHQFTQDDSAGPS